VRVYCLYFESIQSYRSWVALAKEVQTQTMNGGGVLEGMDAAGCASLAQSMISGREGSLGTVSVARFQDT
jgi:hypothetical protein